MSQPQPTSRPTGATASLFAEAQPPITEYWHAAGQLLSERFPDHPNFSG